MKNLNKIKSTERKSIGSLVKESFESIDIFGNPVKLNFNGREKIKTIAGSLVTFVLIVVMLAYIVRKG